LQCVFSEVENTARSGFHTGIFGGGRGEALLVGESGMKGRGKKKLGLQYYSFISSYLLDKYKLNPSPPQYETLMLQGPES